MMPVILATDFLFFLLLGVALIYVVYIRRRPYLLRPWYKLGQSYVAMISATIIVFYIMVAFLDSVHFKPELPSQSTQQTEVIYSNEVLSVLDWALTPLRTAQEKTYSSPFALRAYVKETVAGSERSTREYPRLLHGGQHLSDSEERMGDIVQRSLKGVVQGSVIFVLLVLLLGLIRAAWSRTSLKAQWMSFFSYDKAPLRTVVYTVFFLLIIGCVCYQLGMAYHILGTDKVGEDVFYQAIKSIRTGVMIGTLTTLIMLPFALILGIIAGYFLGRIDDVIQYIYTTLNSIPGVLLIAATVLILHLYMDKNQAAFDNLMVRSDTRLLFLCMILGVTSWTGLCRLLRAETLKIKNMDYITSAKALGVSHARIVMRHILPNVMHIVFITIALDFSGLVLAEAVLSYINIGVDPTMYSWGNMINGGRLEMAREPVVWWSLAGAFIFMFVLVLCANLFSDGLRDAFDPRTHNQEQQ